jgi:hypothetical protein
MLVKVKLPKLSISSSSHASIRAQHCFSKLLTSITNTCVAQDINPWLAKTTSSYRLTNQISRAEIAS